MQIGVAARRAGAFAAVPSTMTTASPPQADPVSGARPLRAVVTGGATNIGRAITEALVARGARVVVGQPDPATAAALVARPGGQVTARAVDVGDPEQCARFVAAAVAELGGLDVLVNNAAITGPGAIALLPDVTPEHFDRMMRVNVGGALFCAQAAAPHLRAAGGGTIVNLSSVNALRPQRGAAAYAASKAALGSLTRSLARELAPDGVRVVAVAPGDIATDAAAQADAEMRARGAGADVHGLTPLGRGRPGDIGAVVAFLVSPEARFVTGATWVVDGGLLA